MDVVAEAKKWMESHTWREDSLHTLQIRYAALLLDIADHRVAMQDKATDADRRLWSVLDREGF